jgi:acetyl-CoA synthetase
MLPKGSSYEDVVHRFRWQVPARYNIGVDVADRQRGDDLALIFLDERHREQRFSFGDISRLSNRFANVLAAQGLARGERLGILLPQTPETAIAHVAAWKAGLVSVPLFTLFGEDALEYRLANSGARALVTDEIGLAKLAAIRDRLPDLRTVFAISGGNAGAVDFHAALRRASAEFASVDTSADDPAIIIYTSGTTDNPKGALHAHRVLLGHLPGVEMPHQFFPQPGDLFWTPADWAWIGGLFDVLMPAWHHGVPVLAYRARKFDPEEAFDLMARYGVRNAFMPPTALKLMRQLGEARRRPGVAPRAASAAAARPWARSCSTGAAPASASPSTSSTARPNATSSSATTRRFSRCGRARWAAPFPATRCVSSMSAARRSPPARTAISASAAAIP